MTTPYLKRERLFVLGFLAAVSAILAHSIRTSWQNFCGGSCPVENPHPAILTAPEAYRVLLPAIDHGVSRILHSNDVTLSDGLIQLLCCLTALYFFYRLAVASTLPGPAARMAAVGLFLAFIQFPLAFVLYQQRPETLPTAMFVAFALLCMTNARQGWHWTALLFLATAVQSFARSDIPLILGVAVTLLSISPGTLQDFGSRAANLLRGVGVFLIAASVQAYLQLVRFPHLPYTTGSPVVFRQNFYAGHFSVFLLALFPFLCVVALAWSRRTCLTAADKVALLATALYLPVWITIGVIAEVRIVVPLLLALCPMAARVSAVFLLQDSQEAAQ